MILRRTHRNRCWSFGHSPPLNGVTEEGGDDDEDEEEVGLFKFTINILFIIINFIYYK